MAGILLSNKYVLSTTEISIIIPDESNFCSTSLTVPFITGLSVLVFISERLKNRSIVSSLTILKPVVVDFFASWSGPCKVLGPIIDELANDYEGRAVIGKMDVESNGLTPMKYGVRSIPTTLVFQGGEVKDTQVGLVDKKQLSSKIDALM